MIFLYIYLIISLGINLVIVLNKLNLIDVKKLQKLEVISLSITSGIIGFTIYMFIIGLVKIEYNFYLFIPIIIGNIFNVIYLGYKIIKNKLYKIKFSFKINKNNILSIVLIFANVIYFIYFITLAMYTNPIYPDEFSVWALNAKNIFIGKKLDLFINTGLENYPNMLPLLYSGFYFFVGMVQDNYVRIFSSIFLIVNFINIISIFKKKEINLNYGLILSFIINAFYSNFYCYASSTYGECGFLMLYTFGLVYLFEWIINDRKKDNLIISIIYMMGACWCKQDGIYLFIYNILIILISKLLYKKLKIEKINWKQILLYGICVSILPLCWKIYTICAGFPSNLAFGAGAKIEMHLEYTISLMQNITAQFFSDIPSILFLGIILLGMIFTFDKLKYNDKIFVIYGLGSIIFNLLFLIMCYIFVFEQEAITAASFIRYYTRVIFIELIICSILLKPIEIKNKE